MTRIAVLGAGSWGTTLADLLARKGLDVALWAYEPEVAESIASRNINEVFLPGCPLAPTLWATADLPAALDRAAVVLLASPSHVTRGVLKAARHLLPADRLVVSATKGIEMDSLALMSAVAREELPGHRFVALSGPSFASEVYQGQPTAVVAAAAEPMAAAQVQDLFATGHFRVYSNADVIGTELAGSLKNVVAVAAGILEGLGLGNNPRAALITRGLAEITRLGQAMGADPRTFAGLAGLGDLVLTTCGAQSRNRQLGIAVAHGTTLEAYRKAHRTVAEGANSAVAAVRLGRRHGVELPIAEQVAAILFEGKPAKAAIGDLMDRTLKPEH